MGWQQFTMVQALMYMSKFWFCKDLGKAFLKFIDSLLQNYKGGRVVCGNYQMEISIKDDVRYSKQLDLIDDLYIEDSTPINNFKKFWASKTIMDDLTLYLEQKVIIFWEKPVVLVTIKNDLTNVPEYHPL